MEEAVRIDHLSRLVRLYELGDLSDEEFTIEKERLQKPDSTTEFIELGPFDYAALESYPAPNVPIFVGLYLLLLIPTYIIPLFGSTSVAFVAMLSGITDEWGWLLQMASIAFLAHAAFLGMLIALTVWHGRRVGQSWIAVFPTVAAAFDLIPGLNFVPFVPTILHLVAIISGVARTQESRTPSGHPHTASASKGMGCVILIVLMIATLFVGFSISDIGVWGDVDVPLIYDGLILETQAVAVWLLAPILIALYLLPTGVAYLRGAADLIYIALLNLFGGWTIIGWVGAIVWSAKGRLF